MKVILMIAGVASAFAAAAGTVEWNAANGFGGARAASRCSAAVTDGVLRVFDMGRDPMVNISNAAVDPDGIERLVYRYRAKGTGKACGQLYYNWSGTSFSDARRWVLPPPVADGEWHTVTLTATALTDASTWRAGGELRNFRLDPTDAAGGEIEYAFIRFEGAQPAKPEAPAPEWTKMLDAPRWPEVEPQYYDHAADPACTVKGPYFTGHFVSAADDKLTTGRINHEKLRTYHLRRAFTLKEKPVEAWLQAMGDNSARFGLNGKHVSSFTYDRGTTCSSVPAVDFVTDKLRKGANELTASYEVSSGFPGGVMLELFVRYADGTTEKIVGDGKFESSADGKTGWKDVALSDLPPVPPRHLVWLTYRNFASPQKLLNGGAGENARPPFGAVAGDVVNLSYEFLGTAPEGEFEAILTMKKGGALAWFEKRTLGPENVARLKGGKWRLTVPFETPLYFNAGTYRLQLESNAVYCRSGGSMTATIDLRRAATVPTFDQPVEACVKDCGGTPQIHVNGRPFNLIWAGVSAWRRPDKRRTLGKAPVTTVKVSNQYTEWHPRLGVYDFTCFDREAEMYRRGNPDAWFIWDLTVYPPFDFMKAFPGEMASDETGDISPVGRFSWSYASKRGLDELKEMIEKAIRHVESSPYANRVIGYRVNSGVTIEWLGWDAKPGRVRDFSEPNKAVFRAFAAERYPQLADPHVPDYKERFALDGDDILWDQRRHLNAIAYMDYNSWIVQRDILETSGHAKAVLASLGRKKVVGTYYGYTYFLNANGRDARRAHFALRDLLRDNGGRVDFLMSPQSYAQRDVGDTCADMKPFKTMQMNGVVPIIEDDTRTYARPYPVYDGYRQTLTKDLSVAALRRNMAIALCHRAPPYYYALVTGTDFDSPALAADVGVIRDVSALLLEKGLSRRAEVALVASERTVTSMPGLNRSVKRGVAFQSYSSDGTVAGGESGCAILNGEIFSHLLNTMARSGAPVDYLLAEDLPRHAGDYKLYVFLNAVAWDDAFKSAVERLRARGAAILWLYAPGFVKDNENGVAYMKELTGIAFEKASEPLVAGVTLKDGRFMGTPKEKVSPMFYPSAPEETLGVYENGRAGLAAFRIGNSQTFFSGAWQLDRPFVRELYRRANVHVWCESDDPVEAGAGLFTLHARSPGVKTVRLAEKATVVDVFAKRIVARETDTFSFTASLHSTHLFYFGPGAERLLK